MAYRKTQSLRLAYGFAAGGPGLSDLPTEGPKDQAKGPFPLTRMSAFVGLRKASRRNPGTKEGFQLMKSCGRGGSEGLELIGKEAGEVLKTGSHAIGQRTRCPIDNDDILAPCQLTQRRKSSLRSIRSYRISWLKRVGLHWAASWSVAFQAKVVLVISGRAGLGPRR